MDAWITSQREELRSDVLKLTLYELNSAIGPRESRMDALDAALHIFNHKDPLRHDEELDMHADKILFQKISFCYSVAKDDEELGLLLCALEMIYRASRARVAVSFHEIGESLLPLFVEMLRYGAARRKDILTKSLSEKDDMANSVDDITDSESHAKEPSHTLHSRADFNFALTPVKEEIEPTDMNDDETTESERYVKSRILNTSGDDNRLGLMSDIDIHEDESTSFEEEKKGEEREKGCALSVVKELKSQDEQEEIATECSTDPDSPLSNRQYSPHAPMDVKAPPKRQVRFSDMVEVTSIDEKTIKLKKFEVTNPLAIKRIIRILRYFSRVLTAMIPMAHFPGLLDELVFQLRIPKRTINPGTEIEIEETEDRYGDDQDDAMSFHSAKSSTSTGSEYIDAISNYSGEENSRYKLKRINSEKNAATIRIDAIATIVNLACAEENKSKLLNHPGLLDAVTSIALDDIVNEAREHASIVLMNLALEDSNKNFMINEDKLLDTILKLLDDTVDNIRRYVSSVILSLAVSDDSKRMIQYCDGKIIRRLSLILVKEEMEEIRINIAECLFNFVKCCKDVETVELMGCNEDLLPALAHSCLSDYSADVRAYTARTLEWLAADIHHDSKCHKQLLDALAEAALWTKTNCIVEALKAQATIAENRKALVQHTGILDALATLASLHGVNDQEVRECALVTIERLAHEPSTRRIMASHEAIMTELTRATFSSSGLLGEYEEGDERSRTLMKSALKYLAQAMK